MSAHRVLLRANDARRTLASAFRLADKTPISASSLGKLLSGRNSAARLSGLLAAISGPEFISKFFEAFEFFII